MHNPTFPLSRATDQLPIGDELTDDNLMLAVGGLWRIDIETVCYDENGKVIDHQIDIFYV